MNIFKSFGLYKTYSLKVNDEEEKVHTHFDYCRLVHIIGLGFLSAYYLYNPKQVLKISFKQIAYNLGVTMFTGLVFSLPEIIKTKKVQEVKEVKELDVSYEQGTISQTFVEAIEAEGTDA